MNWLKGGWKAALIALSAFFAAFAVVRAQQHKQTAEKWKQRADEEKGRDVVDGVNLANQALSQAKFHEAKAKEAKEQARQKLDTAAGKDEDMATILSGWRSSRLRQ